jgi:distribution and morphology protein 10
LNDNWSLGGEVYYTAKEKSGGLSLGTRLKRFTQESLLNDWTLILNPVMGHISTSYSSEIMSRLIVTTKYEFNFFSYDSDVSFGMEFFSSKKDQLLQFRLSLLHVRMGIIIY